MTAPSCAILASDKPGLSRLAGAHLDILVADLEPGRTSEGLPGHGRRLGEEVALVLSGRFTLELDDERHALSAGEAVIVPAGERRTWTCDEGPGRLYRVLRTKDEPRDAADG